MNKTIRDFSTNPPRGMRDFLPNDVHKRRYAMDIIRKVYESHGFEPLETPSLENLSVLSGKYGEEGDRLLFKVLKRGEKLESALTEYKSADAGSETIFKPGGSLADLGLRYDLTVPLARVIADNRGKIPRIFKRYQIQPVWRADRPAKGRFREFYQCDVDIVGSRSPVVEIELLEAASRALECLGFENFTIKLNHRKLLMGFLAIAGVEGRSALSAVIALDKLDKIGDTGVEKELKALGLDDDQLQRLRPLLEAPKGSEALTFLEPFCSSNEEALNGIEETRKILDAARQGPAEKRIITDPCLARGLDYYTGSIFEIESPELGVSLAGGGRYDNLIQMFSGEDLPACGISLGLERLLKVMEEKNLFPQESAGPHVVVTCWSEDLLATTIETTRFFRAAGLRSDTYPDPGKLGRQLKYAEARGTRFAVIIGPDEAEKKVMTLKDLLTGEQITLTAENAAKHLKKTLSV